MLLQKTIGLPVSSVSTTMDVELQEQLAFRAQVTYDKFKDADVGFGPFVVRRQRLLDEIITKAKPKHSVHISGCRGAGKTTVLHQLGQILTDRGKTVYFFKSADDFSREAVIRFVNALDRSKKEVYFLVDETQANVKSTVFTTLLKNNTGHKITTIGAGVPAFETISGGFKEPISTERLFLSSDEMLESEGVVGYFGRNANPAQTIQIEQLLRYIRAHVGGHIYPLMWLAEQLVSKVDAGMTAQQVIDLLHSEPFREREDFKLMTDRILPRDTLSVQVFRALLTLNPDVQSLKELKRHGFCDQENKIISQLLFDTFVLSVTGRQPFPERLNAGVGGIHQLLQFALPHLNWDHYNAHGGPVEDALTFELLVILSRVAHLGTRLFNPKLINYGMARRKPDLYLNTTVDAYVECVLTTANNGSERKKLDEHISRFYWQQYNDPALRCVPAYYQIGESGFAILNFQNFGFQPMEPFDPSFQGTIFDERVFTFLMNTKEVYLGNRRIAGP